MGRSCSSHATSQHGYDNKFNEGCNLMLKRRTLCTPKPRLNPPPFPRLFSLRWRHQELRFVQGSAVQPRCLCRKVGPSALCVCVCVCLRVCVCSCVLRSQKNRQHSSGGFQSRVHSSCFVQLLSGLLSGVAGTLFGCSFSLRLALPLIRRRFIRLGCTGLQGSTV